jgi:putative GTP pyrophosphokinase
MNKSSVDRLGERLRQETTPEDLRLLDSYRRSFRRAYDVVVDRIRLELNIEVSGRPAKSTTAIVDKLRRSSMRFTQMQDIAGCRITVPDVRAQDQMAQTLVQMFDAVVVDRRRQPSHGYRAVHVVVREAELSIEIQIRTGLQHAWAELSEKLADRFGIEIKYGGGPDDKKMLLRALFEVVTAFEEELDKAVSSNEKFESAKSELRKQIILFAQLLRQSQ